MFNMICKNGTRTNKPFKWSNGKVCDRYCYFLPLNKKIIKVTIYSHAMIDGFRFHFSDGSNWEIGWIDDRWNTETVVIAEDEVIVGFKAKSYPDRPAFYTEWQFITAKGMI